METSGRAATSEASPPWGALGRLVLGPSERLTWPHNAFVRYARPLGILLLVGLAWAN